MDGWNSVCCSVNSWLCFSKKTTTTTTTKKKQNSNCTHMDLCRGARSSQSDTVGGSAAAAAASSSLFSCNQHVTLFCVCLCVLFFNIRDCCLLLAAFSFVLLVILSVVRFLNNPGYCISRSLLLSLVWCWKSRRRRGSCNSFLLLCFLFCIACVNFFGVPI